MGKVIGFIVGALVLIGIIWLVITLVDVDQTEEGEMPSVDVDVSGDMGEVPEYDVDVGEVEVGTTTETIKTPEIVMTEEEVEVPVIGIQPPEDDDVEEPANQ